MKKETESLDSNVFSSFSYTQMPERSKFGSLETEEGIEVKKEFSSQEAVAEDLVKPETDIEDFGISTDGSPPNWQEVIDKIRLVVSCFHSLHYWLTIYNKKYLISICYITTFMIRCG